MNAHKPKKPQIFEELDKLGFDDLDIAGYLGKARSTVACYRHGYTGLTPEIKTKLETLLDQARRGATIRVSTFDGFVDALQLPDIQAEILRTRKRETATLVWGLVQGQKLTIDDAKKLLVKNIG